MKAEEIKNYCLDKWKAYEDYPFGDIPICYDTVLHSFSKKIQRQILEGGEDV